MGTGEIVEGCQYGRKLVLFLLLTKKSKDSTTFHGLSCPPPCLLAAELSCLPFPPLLLCCSPTTHTPFFPPLAWHFVGQKKGVNMIARRALGVVSWISREGLKDAPSPRLLLIAEHTHPPTPTHRQRVSVRDFFVIPFCEILRSSHEARACLQRVLDGFASGFAMRLRAKHKPHCQARESIRKVYELQISRSISRWREY